MFYCCVALCYVFFRNTEQQTLSYEHIDYMDPPAKHMGSYIFYISHNKKVSAGGCTRGCVVQLCTAVPALHKKENYRYPTKYLTNHPKTEPSTTAIHTERTDDLTLCNSSPTYPYHRGQEQARVCSAHPHGKHLHELPHRRKRGPSVHRPEPGRDGADDHLAAARGRHTREARQGEKRRSGAHKPSPSLPGQTDRPTTDLDFFYVFQRISGGNPPPGGGGGVPSCWLP